VRKQPRNEQIFGIAQKFRDKVWGGL